MRAIASPTALCTGCRAISSTRTVVGHGRLVSIRLFPLSATRSLREALDAPR